MKLFKTAFLCLVSLLLVAFAQPDWSPLACLITASSGYALFWRGVLQLPSKLGRFLASMIWFGAVEGFHLNWFFSDRYVGFYIYPFLFLLLSLLGCQFALLTLLLKTEAKEYTATRILGLAGLWVLLEWSRLFWLSGFSWDPVGLTLSSTTLTLQMASVIGVFGMSFWVLVTNLSVLRFLLAPKWKIGLCSAALALFPLAFGSVHLAAHKGKQGDGNLKALLVQIALTPEEKVGVGGADALHPLLQWDRILEMLAPYKEEGADLILLSEGALPFGADYPLYAVEWVEALFKKHFPSQSSQALSYQGGVGNAFCAQELAKVFGADVIVGLEDVDVKPNRAENKAYNAAFWFSHQGEPRQRYEKRILVPMGEYIPFSWCQSILSKYGILGSYVRGEQAKVFPIKKAPASPSICYEETYGNLMREGRVRGAKLLVNLTNDMWYPLSRLPELHYYHGRIRAVEQGIPMLRACNTGVTCGVDAFGRRVAALDWETSTSIAQAGVLSLSLPLYHYFTPYTFFGDFPLILISFAFVFNLFLRGFFINKILLLKHLNISLLRRN